ncbi:hypothetical protein N1851_008151 [Merluccius polli]|uniref:SCAN box domain-containing protein n=1 Tax=Merluccius polli TaxID=89951 RepID=A0AA47N2Z4_MERPO|nr:hypothetical protein N1851_008151 [Merluccius polli]
MLIQLEHERMKIDKELALEKIKTEKQLGEMELQRQKLDLVSEGKLSGDSVFDGHGSLESGGASSHPFDIIRNLSLLPKFNERDPDTFFSLFERIADTQGWPVTERTLMLQCAFTGKAQEAYAALSNIDSQSYTKVKAAVLKVYELVPEAYRQHFRNWRRGKTQSHLEFARDLVLHFNRWCTASEVENFESLCDLILLEQFKTAVPQQIATYVGEKEVKTVAEAAALADDYTLTHKGTFGEPRPYVADSGFRRNTPLFDMQPAAGLGRVVGSVYRSDHSAREVDKVCNYCRHWKSECYALRQRSGSSGAQNGSEPQGAGLAAPVVKRVGYVTPESEPSPKTQPSPGFDSYLPFVTEGFVSLLEGDDKVPVKILRDTGAFDTFIVASVLPFSENSDTGDFIPVLGMGMNVLNVPLHKIRLFSDLFQGEAQVGVRPALPIEGVTMILGNGLVGARVWADVPSVVVASVPLVKSRPDDSEREFPEVFTACAVTRAMRRSNDVKKVDDDPETVRLSLSDFPLAVSHGDLFKPWCVSMFVMAKSRADADFGGQFFSLTSTRDLKHKDTNKVVHIVELSSLNLVVTDLDSFNKSASSISIQPASTSSESCDTVMLSSPEYSNRRSQCWPSEFPIPRFRNDTELVLAVGNEAFNKDGCPLSSTAILPDVLETLAESIFEYVAYPTAAQFANVAEAFIQKTSLPERNRVLQWMLRMATKTQIKMGNYRTKLRGLRCPELDVNALKKKRANEKMPAKNVKKPRKGEANYLPPHPQGESQESLEHETLELLSEVKKRNNSQACSFSASTVGRSMINEEYRRITTANLESTFMQNLDQCIPSLMPLVLSRGGAAKKKIQNIMELLKDSEGQIGDLESHVMKILVTKGATTSDPASANIMIEGAEVIEGWNVPRACALLMGLIYALNLSYPRELKYTFEAFQKVFLKLDGQKTTPKVTSLKQKLACRAKQLSYWPTPAARPRMLTDRQATTTKYQKKERKKSTGDAEGARFSRAAHRKVAPPADAPVRGNSVSGSACRCDAPGHHPCPPPAPRGAMRTQTRRRGEKAGERGRRVLLTGGRSLKWTDSDRITDDELSCNRLLPDPPPPPR